MRLTLLLEPETAPVTLRAAADPAVRRLGSVDLKTVVAVVSIALGLLATWKGSVASQAELHSQVQAQDTRLTAVEHSVSDLPLKYKQRVDIDREQAIYLELRANDQARMNRLEALAYNQCGKGQ